MKKQQTEKTCQICHGFGDNGADDASCLNCGGSGIESDITDRLVQDGDKVSPTDDEIVKEFEITWSDFIGDIEFNEQFKHLASDQDVPFILPEMSKWLRNALSQVRKKEWARVLRDIEVFASSLDNQGVTKENMKLLNDIINIIKNNDKMD
jgi:hypothetical protein